MRRWWLVLVLLLSLGVNAGILATIAVGRLKPVPQPRAASQGPPERRLAQLADRLGLRGEERERFLDRERRFFADASRERKHLQQVYRQVRRELISARPDPARLDQLLAESSQIYLTIERMVTANVLDTRKLLTPDQESIYLDLIEKMRPGQGPFTQPNAPGPLWNRGLRGAGNGKEPRGAKPN
ncbi:MAG TPA: periplasmic heavy metal sensor [Thermoanaerobaculia bacterium]|nr:periplasmic heavy metal sensor [Thermoanaerobaculia bacterium]